MHPTWTGFDPRQSLTLWQNMTCAGGEQAVEFLSTHPSHESRSKDLKAHMDSALELYQTAIAHGKQPRC